MHIISHFSVFGICNTIDFYDLSTWYDGNEIAQLIDHRPLIVIHLFCHATIQEEAGEGGGVWLSIITNW